MARKWYGSVMNRLEENKQFGPEIYVGMGMTEYYWSDRHAYEVVEVEDQKHVSVRELGHRLKSDAWNGSYSNDWARFSDESRPGRNLVKRAKYWYWGHVSSDTRANVSFGVARYYYDYSF